MTSIATSVAALPVTREVRQTVHWGVAHGLPTLLLRRAADRGDLQARLIRVGPMPEPTDAPPAVGLDDVTNG